MEKIMSTEPNFTGPNALRQGAIAQQRDVSSRERQSDIPRLPKGSRGEDHLHDILLHARASTLKTSLCRLSTCQMRSLWHSSKRGCRPPGQVLVPMTSCASTAEKADTFQKNAQKPQNVSTAVCLATVKQIAQR